MSKRESHEEFEGSADHPRQIDSRIDMIQNAATEVPSVNGKATTSKERSTMDADTTRPVMEGTEEFIKPIVKDGEIILEVECGQNKALLYLSKLCQGSKGPCIFYQGSWLTPNEFQFVSGRETAKDWKRSIRHHGKSLKLLLAKGILTVHPTVCECEGCRHSSTTPTRCRNGEKRSRVSSSTTDVKGKGTSSPVEHHVNGAFKPVQHVRPQIRVPSTGADNHVIGPKQQEKLCSPLREAAASSVVQEVRDVEHTSKSDKSEQLPTAKTEKTPDKIPVPKTNNPCKNDVIPFRAKPVTPDKTCSTELKHQVPELPSESKKDALCPQVKHKHTPSNCDKVKHKSSKTQPSVSVASIEQHKTIPQTPHTPVSSLIHVPESKSDNLTKTNPPPETELKSHPLISPNIVTKSSSEKQSPTSTSSAVSLPCTVLKTECKKEVETSLTGVTSATELSDKLTSVIPSCPVKPHETSVPTVQAIPAVERVKPTQSHNDKCQNSSDVPKPKPNTICEKAKDNPSASHGRDTKEEKPQKELKHTCSKGKEQSAKLCVKTESVVAIKSESSDVKAKPCSKPSELEVKHKHEETSRLVSQTKHKAVDKKHCSDKDSHSQSSTVSSSVHHKSSSHGRSPDTSSSKKHEDPRPCIPISDPDQMAAPRIGSDVPRIGSDVPPMMQQDAADAACSDYMRLLASGHGQQMMPQFGAMDPLYALRFQEYPITPAALYPHPHSGLLPGDQMLYPNTSMIQSLAPPCFQPAIQMYQPRLPYGIPLQVTEPLKPFGGLPYPGTAVYPCSLNGVKRKQYDSESTSESPQKRLCLDYSQPQFKMDNWPQSYAYAQSSADASRAYADDYNLRKYCEEKYMNSESADAQVFSRWSELAAKTGYCRLCSCTNSRPNDIRFWSVEDVCRFLTRLDGCGIYAENFMEQRVDGRILPLLTTDHLIKNLGMKLGPAVLLTEAVAKKMQEAGKLMTCESCRGLLPGPAV